MAKLVEFSLRKSELEEVFYPNLHDEVFHFTSGKKFSDIISYGAICTSKSADLQSTSIHSQNSAGKHLNAVCLFDLRDKSEEQIAIGKSYYNFLSPFHEESKMVYFVISQNFYKDIITINNLDKFTKESTMYLPEIESWYPGPLSLQKIEKIYVVNILE